MQTMQFYSQSHFCNVLWEKCGRKQIFRARNVMWDWGYENICKFNGSESESGKVKQIKYGFWCGQISIMD